MKRQKWLQILILFIFFPFLFSLVYAINDSFKKSDLLFLDQQGIISKYLKNIKSDCGTNNYLQGFNLDGTQICKKISDLPTIINSSGSFLYLKKGNGIYQNYLSKILNNCGDGSYVKGFDKDKNIVCSDISGLETKMGTTFEFEEKKYTKLPNISPKGNDKGGVFAKYIENIFSSYCSGQMGLRGFDNNGNKICINIPTYEWSISGYSKCSSLSFWGDWTSCDKPCGGGFKSRYCKTPDGIKSRIVECKKNGIEIVDEKFCLKKSKKPEIITSCKADLSGCSFELIQTKSCNTHKCSYPGCNKPDIELDNGQIWSSCNVGSNEAGTGISNYGDYFQWGNNNLFWEKGWSLNNWIFSEYRGPCSNGYHIPTKKEWQDGLISAGGYFTSSCLEKNCGGGNPFDKLMLPMSGLKNEFNGNLVGLFDFGFYWTSSNFLNIGYSIGFNPKDIFGLGNTWGIGNNMSNISGLQVRCIKNKVINGVCGSSDGLEFPLFPTTGLCNNGDFVTSQSNEFNYNWSCNGRYSGLNVNCSAKKGNNIPVDSTSCENLYWNNNIFAGTEQGPLYEGLNYDEAELSCKNLGYAWRIPSKEEVLKCSHLFKDDFQYYWSSTKKGFKSLGFLVMGDDLGGDGIYGWFPCDKNLKSDACGNSNSGFLYMATKCVRDK